MLSSSQITRSYLIALILSVTPTLGCAAGTDAADEATSEPTSEAQQAEVTVASRDFGGAFGYVNGGTLVPNPATGGASCPLGYTATKVLDTTNIDWAMSFCSRPHQPGVDPIFDFGGMWGYVAGAVRNNPITNAASCPVGYLDQKVLDTPNVDSPLHVCFKQHVALANTEYLFGGMWGYVNFGTLAPNPATGDASCPTGHTATQVYGTGNLDYSASFCWARPTSRDFGGAFGYVNGGTLVPNPLTGGASCPLGYTATKVLDTTNIDWAMTFCSRPHEFGVDPIFDFGGMWGTVAGAVVNNPITNAPTCLVGYTDQKVLDKPGVDSPLHVCYKAHVPGTNPTYLFGGMWGYVNGGTLVPNPATGAASCLSGHTTTQVYGTVNLDYSAYFCFQ